MRAFHKMSFLAAAALLAAWPAASQMPQMRLPDFKGGQFNPVVGSGAAYEVQGKSGKSQIEIDIVGKEDVAGKTGYWNEIAVTSGDKGQMVMKHLMVLDGNNATIAKVIIQAPGMGPMDMTSMMMGNRQQKPPEVDARKQGKQVGSESITTPAGTFECQHWRANDGSWDAWLSPKVNPWGLVKSVDKSNGEESTMVLTRVITNATDHITGTPQQMNMQDLMRQAQQQRGR